MLNDLRDDKENSYFVKFVNFKLRSRFVVVLRDVVLIKFFVNYVLNRMLLSVLNIVVVRLNNVIFGYNREWNINDLNFYKKLEYEKLRENKFNYVLN